MRPLLVGGHLLQERQACLVDCPSQPDPAYTAQSPSVYDQDDDNGWWWWQWWQLTMMMMTRWWSPTIWLKTLQNCIKSALLYISYHCILNYTCERKKGGMDDDIIPTHLIKSFINVWNCRGKYVWLSTKICRQANSRHVITSCFQTGPLSSPDIPYSVTKPLCLSILSDVLL